MHGLPAGAFRKQRTLRYFPGDGAGPPRAQVEAVSFGQAVQADAAAVKAHPLEEDSPARGLQHGHIHSPALTGRCSQGLTQVEAARELGISQVYCSRRERKALRPLRAALH